MIEGLWKFARKHFIIKNQAILVVFLIILIYRMTFSLYSFSILRFLAGSIGHDYVLIGIFMAISNCVALLSDIPIGILQKHIRPRYFILLSVLLLMISDLFFLMASSAVWIAFLSVLFYQLSVEIFFITIVTFILRMSTKEDSASNVAQSDIIDNTGDMIGMALGGVLFTLDRAVNAHNSVIIIFLLCMAVGLFLFVLEFADNRNHNALEKTILDTKLSRKLIGTAQKLAGNIVINADTQPAQANVQEAPTEMPEPKINIKEISGQVWETMKTTAKTFFSAISHPGKTPMLLWIMVIIIAITFMNESFGFFEPFFMKFLYSSEDSAITENITRYVFESGMLLASLLIPTFVFEYPLSKISDKWGKHKMIVACTIISGASLLFLAVFSKTFTLFMAYLIMGIAFVGLYPCMVSLLNEELGKVTNNATNTEKPSESIQANEPKTEESDGDGEEGISAAIYSILMNIGQIVSGLITGVLMALFSFNIISLIIGFLLFSLGIGSLIFLIYLNNKKKAEQPVAIQ